MGVFGSFCGKIGFQSILFIIPLGKWERGMMRRQDRDWRCGAVRNSRLLRGGRDAIHARTRASCVLGEHISPCGNFFLPIFSHSLFVVSLLIIIIRYLLWSVKYLPLHIVVFIFLTFFGVFRGIGTGLAIYICGQPKGLRPRKGRR